MWPPECPGCSNRHSRDHWSHNREIDDCSCPFDSPKIWDCDACNEGVDRYRLGHSGIPGECRWEEIGVRQSAPRTGAHPREPRAVLHLIPDIVDTCVACRAWAKPLPDARASVEITDAFNAVVQCDLLFIYRYIISLGRQMYSMAPCQADQKRRSNRIDSGH